MGHEWAAATSRDTPIKLDHFAYVLETHLGIVAAILGKHRGWAVQAYHYIDLTAGPGFYPELDGRYGSPLLFKELAAGYGFPSRAWYCEQDPATAAALQDYLSVAPIPGRKIEQYVLPFDHDVALPGILEQLRGTPSKRYGLAYADPNGTRIPVAALQRIAADLPRLDLLLYVAANGYYKRVRGAGVEQVWLERDLQAIGKRYWCVQEPHGAQQWTLLFGTNWSQWNRLQEIGLYRLDTDRGRAIMDRLNVSRRDLWRPWSQLLAEGSAERGVCWQCQCSMARSWGKREGPWPIHGLCRRCWSWSLAHPLPEAQDDDWNDCCDVCGGPNDHGHEGYLESLREQEDGT